MCVCVCELQHTPRASLETKERKVAPFMYNLFAIRECRGCGSLTHPCCCFAAAESIAAFLFFFFVFVFFFLSYVR